MRVKILKSIAGVGDIVEGSRHEFGLDAGMIANVEDETAIKWIGSGIASEVDLDAVETAVLPVPETATKRRTRDKRR